MKGLEFQEPSGLVQYQEGLEIQLQAHKKVVGDILSPQVIILQHPKTITMGKHSSHSHLKVDIPVLSGMGCDFFTSDRGGQVTGHEPGQLVVYPILPLTKLGLSVRQYVCKLEQAVIDLCALYGIQAHRDREHPGVWVGECKICALGIRVSKRVSMHGLALNVDNDFKVFNWMTPCGIQGRGVTSLANEINGTAPSIEEVKGAFKAILVEKFVGS